MSTIKIKNNKLTIVIVALTLAILGVAAGIVAVLAAAQQNITSNFNVRYEIGENVTCEVRTESYAPGLDKNNDGKEDGPIIATKDANGNTLTNDNGYIVFKTPDEYTEKEVIIEDVPLSPQTPKVEFLYTINNINEQGYIQYDLIKEFTTDINIKTTTYYYAGDEVDPTKSATTYTSTGWVETNVLNLPAGETTAVKFVITAKNVNQNADGAGTFGFRLIYTNNATRDAGTVDKTAFIEESASTSSVVFDEYSSATTETYTGVTLGTGTDVSVEQNGTVNLYNVGDTTYVLSHEPIMLPEDCSNMFATDTATTVSLSTKALSTRTAKTSIVLRNINTTRVKNMSNMFAGSAVTELDLTNFNTIRAKNMSSMFANCASLTKVYVSDAWQTETVYVSDNMFAGCTNLQNYNAEVIDKTNANKGNGGYLSEKVEIAGTLSKSLWLEYLGYIGNLYFDAYTSITAEEYVVNGTNLIEGETGIDISEEQNGSVKLYVDTSIFGGDAYVLAHGLIAFPEDSSNLFNNNAAMPINQVTFLDDAHRIYTAMVEPEPEPTPPPVGARLELVLSNIDTSNVTNMSYMFYDNSYLTSLDMSNFNTTNVTNMSYMFYGCGTFITSYLEELDISSFDTRKVTDMSYMFSSCSALTNIYVGDDWTTQNVTNSTSMFYSCTKLPNFDSSVIDKTNAHYGEGGYLTYKGEEAQIAGTLSKSLWANYNSTLTEIYFDEYTSDSTEEYVVSGTNVISGVTGIDISEEQNGSVKLFISGTKGYILAHNLIAFPEDSSYLFEANLTNYISSNITNFNIENRIDKLTSQDARKSSIKPLVAEPLESVLSTLILNNIDTSNVTDMSHMFSHCSLITSLDLSNFNTSKVTEMSYMFYCCSSLTSLDLSNFNTSKVTDMSSMFRSCGNLTSLDLSNFDTSEVTNMIYMFNGCSSLTSLDLSNFNTSKVTDMSYMFLNCTALTNIYVGDDWITTNVTSSSNMFKGCTKLPNFNKSVVGKTNAHYGEGGYLTYKAN